MRKAMIAKNAEMTLAAKMAILAYSWVSLPSSKASSAISRGDGEADPGEHADGGDVQPGQPLGQRGPCEPCGEPGPEQYADRLADDQSQDHADGHRVLERRGQALSPKIDTRGEEREHRDAEPCGDGVNDVLNTLGGRLVLAGVLLDPGEHRQRDTGHGRMYPASCMKAQARNAGADTPAVR